jgi:hypothetical protein
MTDASLRERLSEEEASAWGDVVQALDRIPPARFETAGDGPDAWSAKDIAFHLAAWWEDAASELEAVREGRYVASSTDTDARNAEYLRAGRALDARAARVRLERARARGVAEWSAIHDVSAPAVEWFSETGAEHYAEHLDELRSLAGAVGSEGRPGTADRRAAMLAAEAEGWSEIDGLVASIAPDGFERPGVTPDGWTVKDTMWHVAKWWEDFIDAVPRFQDPAFDPDDETAEEVDALNRAWFEESRGLPADGVRDRWHAARDEGVAAFRAMSDPPPTAERWFAECGLIHYGKHLIDLRSWVRNGAYLRGSDAPRH